MDTVTEFLLQLFFWFGNYYHHLAVIVIIISGLGVMILRDNILQKLVGLSLLQSSLFLFFINLGYIQNKIAPIIAAETVYLDYFNYVNPLPQAIVLTAIVVGLSTTAVGCCLVIRIKEDFQSTAEEFLYKK